MSELTKTLRGLADLPDEHEEFGAVSRTVAGPQTSAVAARVQFFALVPG